ncbi:MAG TPA: phage baseplate assembly protein V [Vicinamibacterales bacterium]|nr:phage baseplate assembly protein V [Vicinamibacterales bacterium]
MPIRSRISSAMDMQLLAEGVSRPGIDTRTWVSLAIVDAVNVVDGEGVYVDVTLIPIGNPETVRMGAPYAGDGFGSYAPVKQNDEVVVMFPDGDPNVGGIIVARLWSASDPPPSEAVNNPDDYTLRIADGSNLWLKTSGDGTTKWSGDVDAIESSNRFGSSSDFWGVVWSQHYSGAGDAPIAIPGTATSGGPVIVTGTDSSGLITATSNASPPGLTGPICTVLFNKEFASTPNVLISPANALAATVNPPLPAPGPFVYALGTSTQSFDLIAGGILLTGGPYMWTYKVEQ